MENVRNYFNEGKILILDGAIGSILEKEYPSDYNEHLWMTFSNKNNPDAVIKLQSEYIENGADIITANTFRTSICAYKQYYEKNFNGETIEDIKQISNDETIRAVKLANKVKQSYINKNVIVAGSNSPAEDCYSQTRTLKYEEIYDNHLNHIKALMDAGSDFILHETFGHFDEIDIINKICFNNNFPSIPSLIFKEDLTLYSNETIDTAMRYCDSFNPLCVSINCVDLNLFNEFVNKHNNDILSLKSGFGYYLNCGPINWNQDEKNSITPEDITQLTSKYLFPNLKMIGTCCMSSPSYTKALRSYLDTLN